MWLTRIASCVQTDGSAESFTRPAMHKRRARVNISATRCRYGIYGEFSWAFVLEEKGEGNPRLIVRTRASWGRASIGRSPCR